MLNPRQELFCLEYLTDLNGKYAAIRAGYSENSAASIAAENLTKPEIQTRIAELMKERVERTKITADMVLQELAKIGFSNVQDFIDSGTSVKDLLTIDREKAAAVASVKKTVVTFGEGGERETVEFKLHDKLTALEKIGKHIGFFEVDNKQKAELLLTAKKPDPKDLSDEDLAAIIANGDQ